MTAELLVAAASYRANTVNTSEETNNRSARTGQA